MVPCLVTHNVTCFAETRLLFFENNDKLIRRTKIKEETNNLRQLLLIRFILLLLLLIFFLTREEERKSEISVYRKRTRDLRKVEKKIFDTENDLKTFNFYWFEKKKRDRTLVLQKNVLFWKMKKELRLENIYQEEFIRRFFFHIAQED